MRRLKNGASNSGLEDEVNRARASTSVSYNNVSENREWNVKNVTIGGISVAGPAVVFFGKGAGRDRSRGA